LKERWSLSLRFSNMTAGSLSVGEGWGRRLWMGAEG